MEHLLVGGVAACYWGRGGRRLSVANYHVENIFYDINSLKTRKDIDSTVNDVSKGHTAPRSGYLHVSGSGSKWKAWIRLGSDTVRLDIH